MSLILTGCQPPAVLNVKTIASALTCGCPVVTVAGIIENRSDNYFNNPRFYLKDATAEVAVRPWLPLEVAPYHPAVLEKMKKEGKRPSETMAAYLGVPVRIDGRLEGNVLVVEHAERIKK